MSAMNKFLSDYEKGKAEGRYVFHELPNKLPYEADSFLKDYKVKIVKTEYEFQKGDNKLLIIRK